MNRTFNTKTCESCGSWTQRVVGFEDGMELLECECGSRDKAPPPNFLYVKTKSLRFPYFNACLGQKVDSRDHESHVAREMGMTPVESPTLGGARPRRERKIIPVTKR